MGGSLNCCCKVCMCVSGGGCDCVGVGVIVGVGVVVIAWVRKGVCGWWKKECVCVCVCVCVSVWVRRVCGLGWIYMYVGEAFLIDSE